MLCLLCITRICYALPVEDLYVAEVLVTDRSQSWLNRGARSGLQQVLLRVSGTPGVISDNLVADALKDPSSYYNQYGYETTDRTLLIDGEPINTLILKVHFDPSAVARLLRSAGFPVWGSNRPGVLLWIAVSDDQGRRILGESDEGEFVQQLKNQAKLRGLPLLFPLLDLEDTAIISTAEIWGTFHDRVDDASVRYNPDCIIMGRIQVDDLDRWSAYWSYRIDTTWLMAENVSSSSEEITRIMVDRLADALARRYALDSSRDVVTMRVEAIDDLEDYAGLSEYLESLTPVLDTVVMETRGNEVEFRLSIEGQRRQLVETIELDKKLSLIRTGDSDSMLYYRWLP
ncbi:MAG: DUF2066 domain-containing protein [Gammaproteobacteria bacterium]|nr:DUF2066 domain-containing protein [Gammaproteobacteria bacterium]